MADRFHQDVISLKPRALIILGGTNDAWIRATPAAIPNSASTRTRPSGIPPPWVPMPLELDVGGLLVIWRMEMSVEMSVPGFFS
ncbi:hypothetical protein P378_20100 [Desulforamulus profundi]|uniref:Uncharacterized protein n=1 Tax=Desulforamulus profundi TaxID=1383067 RepID=A0A2C6MB70_9FIRM|nr:hypothetical protein [Desulforamulus profundi]PHJ36812.1 hypothetical protein P378_20100 [Desulforamulus profundi]